MVADSFIRPRCFLDIEVANKPAGRVVVELFSDITPRTCENFRALCTGERGLSKMLGKALHYKDVPIHRIIKNFMIQSGDFTNGNGTGGESIYGGVFPDENFQVKHDKEFLLSMANRGKDTNGSQFFLTTAVAPHLDGVHVVFGQVVSGKDIVRSIENLRVDDHSRPTAKVVIANCGELVPQPKSRGPRGRRRAGSVSSDSSSSSSSSSESSDSSSSDSDAKDHSRKRKRKSQKKKSKSKKSDSEDEKGGKFCTVRADEIPDIPAHRFLYRGSPPKRDADKGKDQGRDRDRDRDRDRRGPPPRYRTQVYRSKVQYTQSGRKIKGRGTVRFRSRSRERARSTTPPHWKREQERLKPFSKELTKRSFPDGESKWRKGDKLAYEDRWGRHRRDSSSEEDSFTRNKKEAKAREEERLRQESLAHRFQKASDREASSEERRKKSRKDKKQRKHRHKKRSKHSHIRPRSPSISSPSSSDDEVPRLDASLDRLSRHEPSVRSPSPIRRIRQPMTPPLPRHHPPSPPPTGKDRFGRDLRPNGHPSLLNRGNHREVQRVPTIQSIVHSTVHMHRPPPPRVGPHSPCYRDLDIEIKTEPIKLEPMSPGQLRSSSSRSPSRSPQRSQRSQFLRPASPVTAPLEDVPLPGLSPPQQDEDRYDDAPPSPSSSSSDDSPAPQLAADAGLRSAAVYTQVKGNNILMAKPGRILRKSISPSPSKSDSNEDKEKSPPSKKRQSSIPGLSPDVRNKSSSRSRSRSRSQSRSRSRSRSVRRSPWPPRRDSRSPRRDSRQSRSPKRRSPYHRRSSSESSRSRSRSRSYSPRRRSRSPRRRPSSPPRDRRRRSPSSSGSNSSVDFRRTFSRKRTPDYVPRRKVNAGRYGRYSRSRSRSRSQSRSRSRRSRSSSSRGSWH